MLNEQEKIDALTNFDLKRIEHQDGEDAKLAREELSSLVDYFLSLCRDNKDIKNLDSFLLIENNLNELTTLYVNHVVMYNADVLGFNFWISFYPTRYIYKILKFKKRILSLKCYKLYFDKVCRCFQWPFVIFWNNIYTTFLGSKLIVFTKKHDFEQIKHKNYYLKTRKYCDDNHN